MTLPINLRSLFFKSLRWNALDACVYQGVLTVHYAALFCVTDPHFFGIMGSLFSLVFLLATIATAGLDGTLSAFFTRTCTSQDAVRSKIMRHVLASAFLGVAIGLGALVLARFLPNSLPRISPSLALMLVGVLVCESIKKSLRMFLQLAFRANHVALIESMTVSLYVGIVWFSHYWGVPFTLETLFFPMLICWLCSTIAFSFSVYHVYRTLPKYSHTEGQEPISHKRLIHNRSFNLLNQLVHQLFSSNFLVPFFALRGGFAVAGLIKIICYLSYGLTSIIQKMVGFSVSALFAQIEENKIMRQAVPLAQRALFGTIAFVLFLGALVLIGAHLFSGSFVHMPTPAQLGLLVLIFFIQISENFFTAYERLLIVRERTIFLAILNGITALVLFGALQITRHESLVVTLFLLLVIRAISFYCLRTYAQRDLKSCDQVPSVTAHIPAHAYQISDVHEKNVPQAPLEEANKNDLPGVIFEKSKKLSKNPISNKQRQL